MALCSVSTCMIVLLFKNNQVWFFILFFVPNLYLCKLLSLSLQVAYSLFSCLHITAAHLYPFYSIRLWDTAKEMKKQRLLVVDFWGVNKKMCSQPSFKNRLVLAQGACARCVFIYISWTGFSWSQQNATFAADTPRATVSYRESENVLRLQKFLLFWSVLKPLSEWTHFV